jgi:lipid A 4'-phosphatase
MNVVKLQLKQYLRRKDWLLCIGCGIVFYCFPEVDLWVSAKFFDGEAFYLNQNPWVYGLYRLFANLHFIALGGLIVTTIGSLFVNGYKAKMLRKSCSFIFVMLLLGPGLIVNGLLKNHSLGRARPVQVEQFGGHAHFTPAFVYSGQCHTNCSFVSGHAALGFAFMSLFFIFRRPIWLVSGMSIGILVGLGRIMQGGHFFSDILFSFWVMYFSMIVIALFFDFSHYQQHNYSSLAKLNKA